MLSSEELTREFADFPIALENALRIVEECSFDLRAKLNCLHSLKLGTGDKQSMLAPSNDMGSSVKMSKENRI